MNCVNRVCRERHSSLTAISWPTQAASAPWSENRNASSTPGHKLILNCWLQFIGHNLIQFNTKVPYSAIAHSCATRIEEKWVDGADTEKTASTHISKETAIGGGGEGESSVGKHCLMSFPDFIGSP